MAGFTVLFIGRDVLARAHLTHEFTYLLTSLKMLGHQNIFRISPYVLCAPRCPMYGESWHSYRSTCRRGVSPSGGGGTACAIGGSSWASRRGRRIGTGSATCGAASSMEADEEMVPVVVEGMHSAKVPSSLR